MPATARAACLIPSPPADFNLQTARDYAGQLMGVIVKCDIARQLGVDVHDGEHADEDAWRRTAYPRAGDVIGGG